MKCSTIAEAQKRYGEIINGKWQDELNWMIIVPISPAISPYWKNNSTGADTRRVYCNKDMAGPLIQALDNIKSRGLLKQLYTFDGLYCIRNVRNSGHALSTHAYGLAIDINAATNQLSTDGDLQPAMVQCFTDAGFNWGGSFHRKDPMHFSYAWEGK